MSEPALRAPSFAAGKLARLDRALGQQPGDDVHDPRRDLERLAGEADSDERLQRAAVVAAGIVEIGARLVGEQHRLRVEAVDQARRDPRLGLRSVRIRPSAQSVPFFMTRLKTPECGPAVAEFETISPSAGQDFRR